ncbi:hypothetical protein INT45_012324 [Circinella minor]|uniref:Uncharacterized protein n=1 Tax=Circinella minor TaxID=1195481 RepID=A0A8H7VJN8_9FUNG|nr:hypothetical protein INT45_012324 [Circinella minor]
MSFLPFVGISATYSRLLTQQEDNNNNNRKGLKTLEFIPKCQSYDYEEKDPKIDEMMARITQKNHSTLKSLIFELDSFAMTDVKSLQVLAELGAPNLTKLVLRQNNHLCRLTPAVLADLIKASPNLHTVELSGTNFWDDTVLEALGDLLNLRQFSMYLDNHGMTMEPTPPKDDQGIISIKAMQKLLAKAKKLTYFGFGAAERQGESFYVIDRTLTYAQKRSGESPHRNARYPRHLPRDLLSQVAQTIATSCPNIKEFYPIAY